jgi:hypothetical protein
MYSCVGTLKNLFFHITKKLPHVDKVVVVVVLELVDVVLVVDVELVVVVVV